MLRQVCVYARTYARVAILDENACRRKIPWRILMRRTLNCRTASLVPDDSCPDFTYISFCLSSTRIRRRRNPSPMSTLSGMQGYARHVAVYLRFEFGVKRCLALYPRLGKFPSVFLAGRNLTRVSSRVPRCCARVYVWFACMCARETVVDRAYRCHYFAHVVSPYQPA